MKHRRTRPLLALALAIGLAVLPAPHARAHETDNFYLPLDREFADLGSFFDAVHARAVRVAVEQLNGRIEAALKIADPGARAARLAELHDPETLVTLVHAQFNDAFTEVIDIEDAVRGPWARAQYPGQITANWDINWMYASVHFPLDPRRLVLLFQSSTVKAYGSYFGTDKLSHFHHMGRYYYDTFRELVREGRTPDEATAEVVRRYSRGGELGENALLGFIATGVYSNADLCANYMGFKFYRNLTEPVTLKGVVREPLVARCGVFWRVAPRVRPESGWFGDFVSDHWNEALNPNLYDDTIRGNVKSLLRRRANHIVEFYTSRDHRPRDPAYYDNLAHTLSTLDGEPYGHSGEWEHLMTIGNTCLAALSEPPAAPATTPTPEH